MEMLNMLKGYNSYFFRSWLEITICINHEMGAHTLFSRMMDVENGYLQNSFPRKSHMAAMAGWCRVSMG